MSRQSIILLGGGGHCKSAIDLIISTGLYTIEGIIDVKEKVGQTLLGFPIIGSDDELDSIVKHYKCFAVTIGQIKSFTKREFFFRKLQSLNAELPVIISPSAHVSSFSKIGSGTMIFHQAVVNADAIIGENCIINNLALVEHDVIISENCHISTGAVLNGGVLVNKNCFIGSNSTIRQGITIGENSVVGAASLVIKDIPFNSIVGGVPAISIGKNG